MLLRADGSRVSFWNHTWSFIAYPTFPPIPSTVLHMALKKGQFSPPQHKCPDNDQTKPYVQNMPELEPSSAPSQCLRIMPQLIPVDCPLRLTLRRWPPMRIRFQSWNVLAGKVGQIIGQALFVASLADQAIAVRRLATVVRQAHRAARPPLTMRTMTTPSFALVEQGSWRSKRSGFDG